MKRLAQRLKRTCYEAGPGGFALQRQLEAAGIECRVIAPALIPRRPGDRVKTDRRDARKLAELLRADLLTAVHPPTIDQEAVREREDAVTDRTRARHRREAAAAARHRLRRPELDAAAPPLAADAALRTPRRAGHLRRLPACARAAAHAGAGTGRVCRQRRLPRRPVTADGAGRTRRRHALRQRPASYLGLTPSEYSSGARQRRGPITKTGNSQWRARGTRWGQRCEAGRASRAGPWCWRPGGAPHRRLAAHGKPSVVANVAVARELAGYRRRRPDSTRAVRGAEQEGVDERGQAQEDARQLCGSGDRQPARRRAVMRQGLRQPAIRVTRRRSSAPAAPRSRPPPVLIDNRSLHISCSSQRARAVGRRRRAARWPHRAGTGTACRSLGDIRAARSQYGIGVQSS